jgi:hypothetical protein
MVAKSMGRRYVGIDINPAYVKMAEARVRDAPACPPALLVGRPKYPGKAELQELAGVPAGSIGRAAESKHKRKTYGRRVSMRRCAQLPLG